MADGFIGGRFKPNADHRSGFDALLKRLQTVFGE
jgi:hypothetical protein